MTKRANGWPKRPGFPLDPDSNGWHWLSWQGERPRVFEWEARAKARNGNGGNGAWFVPDFTNYGNDGRAERYEGAVIGPQNIAERGFIYLGPCLPPSALTNDAPAMLEALKQCAKALDAAFDSEGNPFGREHNNATDALLTARALIAKHMEPNQ